MPQWGHPRPLPAPEALALNRCFANAPGCGDRACREAVCAGEIEGCEAAHL